MAIVGWALNDLAHRPPSYGWFVITIATAVIGAYNVKIPGLVARLSLSEPTVFLATLLYGPAAGTLTAAVDALAMSLRLVPRLRTAHRILFNVGTLAASVLPASILFFGLTGINEAQPSYGPVETFVGPLYAFAITVFLINSGIVATALGIERAGSPLRIWISQFPWLSANYLASASIAAILVVFSQALDFALAALLLPLVVVSVLAYRTTLGRLDDANEHLTQVNQLYISTIETLAMAIDAKDQVTHGHIRRVQRYAVALARAVGVSDEKQIKAIEAAALLHDMGKLAIPEFILNKPGKLTAREFSVMKTHAAIGADLLSSIHFPYPVVPIVRHHHENWDGTGYPDGLSGAQIPIGARILAVVDCYDALTSHRPYRPAMGSTFALDVLTQRRGRMYDPLVVDAFVAEHDRLCQADEQSDATSLILGSQAELGQATTSDAVTDGASVPIESLKLLAAISPYQGGPSPATVCRQVIDSLRSIASFESAAVLYPSDRVTELDVLYADGSAAGALSTSRPSIGERLSGWVAANKTAVWNADAALDLSHATGIGLAVGSSLPLCIGDVLIGVITLYGRSGQEITMAERRVVEWLLPSIATTVDAALQRPGLVIDCSSSEVLTAALSALDALLSHDRHSSEHRNCGVVAVSVAALPRLDSANSLDIIDAKISNALAPRLRDNRCDLVLSPGQHLYCALDGVSPDALSDEVLAVEAGKIHGVQSVHLATINSALELQDTVRRMLASRHTPVGRTEPSTVH